MRSALILSVFGALALAVLGSAASGPTYNRDVAPILDAKCASCHRLGGIAPFPLTTAAQAKAHAAGIVRMTKAGAMPPWMPGADSASFVGRDTRRLTADELSTLAEWAAAGAPAGNATSSRGILMKFTRSAVLLAVLAFGLVGMAGCANQKEPAEQAMAGIEKSLEGSGAQLQKYLPERYEEDRKSVV